jgi:branched-chain amino acid transport system substrate-binding protein
VEQINAEGGVLDRPVELVVRDTMADPARGTAAMEELIDDVGVVAVVGEVHSSVALAEIEVAHERGVPFVVAESWADEITEAGYPEVFRIAPANSLIYESVGAWLAAAGFGTVAIIVEETAYGSNATDLIGSALDAAGVGYSVVDVDPANIDADGIVAGLPAADLIMVLIASDTAYPLINAICDGGLAPTSGTALYIGAGLGVADSLWDQIGDCGRYAIAENLVLPRAQWNELARGLAESMASEGLNASIGGFAGFDSVRLMAEVIERAGSTDGDDIIAALASTGFTGARGVYSFSSEEEPSWRYQQFLAAPLTVIQYLESGQPATEAAVLTPAEWATIERYAVPE